MRFTLRQVEYFIATAETGSITLASSMSCTMFCMPFRVSVTGSVAEGLTRRRAGRPRRRWRNCAV